MNAYAYQDANIETGLSMLFRIKSSKIQIAIFFVLVQSNISTGRE